MASVVCTAGEEPALILAKYLATLAWADAGEEVSQPRVTQSVEEASSLLSSSKTKDLLSLLLTSSDTVFPKLSAQDLECVVSLLVNLVSNAADAADKDSMVELIVSKLSAVNAANASVKLRLLFLLHNVVPPSSPSRLPVLLCILKAASEAKLADQVLPNLRRLELTKQPWLDSLDLPKKRELYRAVSTLLRDHLKAKAPKEEATCTLKYLGLFSAEEASANADVREAAAQAALGFLKAADVYESDLLDVPAVHSLEKDPKHGVLYQLLKIFLTAKYPQFATFREANPDALQSLGLGAEECDIKMRLISIASAAADSLSAASVAPAAGSAIAAPGAAPGVGEIRYAVLQETLQVKDDIGVESLVVKAISAGLVDAKLDQMRQTVIVSRASQRVFGAHQWQELRSRLLNWKENVSNVSKVAHQALAGSSAAVAAQGAAVVG